MASRAEPRNSRRAFGAGPALAACFLAAWLGLAAVLWGTLARLWPSLVQGDPTSGIAGALLFLLGLHLVQGVWYCPRRPSAPPVFIRERFFSAPVVLLFLPAGRGVETGPALAAAATAEEREALLAAAEARLAGWTLIPRLTLLLDNRSPLDLGLRALAGALPRPLTWPVRLFSLILSPSRQFLRLWGFIFFRAWQAWGDPGPVDELTDHKRRVAFDLFRRATELAGSGGDPPTAVELARILAALRRVYHDPEYGQGPGQIAAGAWPAPETVVGGEGLYTAPHLNPRYGGVYLDLPAALGGRTVEELFGQSRGESPDLFYSPELGREVQEAALAATERDRLKFLLAERRDEGILWLDGRPVPTWRVESAIFDLEDRLEQARKRVAAHHRRCRGSHLAVARRAGQGWPEALLGLAGLVHFAEHGRQTLDLARADFYLAVGALRGEGRRFGAGAPTRAGHDPGPPQAPAMVSVAVGLFTVIRDLADRLARLELTPEMEVRPGTPGPAASLAPPGALNLKSWLDDWSEAADELSDILEKLRLKALAALLAAEECLDRFSSSGVPLGTAPPAPAPAADYPAPFRPPEPPERVYSPAGRLGVGFGRCLLAGLILALLSWQARELGQSRLVIYNGLGRTVTVTVDGRDLTVAPFGHAQGPGLRPGRVVRVLAAAGGRPIEEFSQRTAATPGQEVYNVAGAAPLMEWRNTLTPNRDDNVGGRFLAHPRWLTTRATVLFRTPPPDREALVLSGYGDSAPGEILDALATDQERRDLILLRARWDSPLSSWFRSWQALVPQEDSARVLLQRLAVEPDFLEQCVRWYEGTGVIPDENEPQAPML